MNNDTGESVALVKDILGRISGVDVVKGSNIALAAQNLYHEDKGAFTGEIRASMLLDLGVSYVIVGHSERRHIMGESNELVNLKVLTALKNGLLPIICVGETLDQRKQEQTFTVVDEQLLGALSNVQGEDATKITIAYEPVWAIGTGEVATREQAQEVHEHIRKELVSRFSKEAAGKIRIQYGGSVKPDNAAQLLEQPDIDGALVGGASLKAEPFEGIIRAGAS